MKRRRIKTCQRKPFQNYVIFHHFCISQVGCRMLPLQKHRGKRNMMWVQRWGGDFCCYSSCSLKVDHLFDKPIIKKMRQNLKHSVEMTQQYSKYPYGPKKAYKGWHYKGKTYDDRSSQQQQSCNKNNNNQD